MKIGIDFGTSFSLPAVKYLNQNIILLPGGKYGIPSVFYYNQEDGVLIGEEAQRAGQGEEAINLKREIKLELNSSFEADGKVFTGKQIVGYILNHVKENALFTAHEKLLNEKLEGVVISVPAAFTHNEKNIIKEAAEMPISLGGPELNVLGFIKEPNAAALAYFQTSLEDQTRILVYDLGGGTFDTAIVEADSKAKEKYRVIDSSMDRIGGKDWDNKIASYLLEEFEKKSGRFLRDNPGYQEKIKREAIVVKHAFSEKTLGKYPESVKARIEIDGRTYKVPITKVMFDQLTKSLFKQTIKTVQDLMAKNTDRPISKIICVGGGSNMPQVQEGLKAQFKDIDIQIFEPEKAIAIGAAIYAEFCDEKPYLLADISAFSYGVRCYKDYDEDPNKLIIENFIKVDDQLPVTCTHNYLSIYDNQSSIKFEVFENEYMLDEYDCNGQEGSSIMEVTIDLPPNSPKGTRIVVEMTLGIDGLLEITATSEEGKSISANKQLFY